MVTRGIPQQHPNGDHHRLQRPPPQSPYAYQQHRNYYAARTPPSSSSTRSSCKGCCCCILLLLCFIALLLLGILLFMVLSVKPKKPQIELEQVDVQYVGITQNDPVTATLSLAIRLLFAVVNPNRVGIRYGDSRFTIMYRGIPLGRANVPGFYQDPHSVRDVVATVAVDRVGLVQADAAELVKDATLGDRVEFRVLGDVSASIRVLHFNSPRVQVSVDCVIVISPRKQSVTYKQCGIDALNV